MCSGHNLPGPVFLMIRWTSSPEPIFGLAVTGKVPVHQIKRNMDGLPGDQLYITKPLGIGIVTTAQKKKLAMPEDLNIARRSMLTLNSIGKELGSLNGINAVTDVTGFGLGGHLIEVCDAGNTSAIIYDEQIPTFDFVKKYIDLGCIPGGTNRNWKTYGKQISLLNEDSYKIMADPQTSGGLLISVAAEHTEEFELFMVSKKHFFKPIGELTDRHADYTIKVM